MRSVDEWGSTQGNIGTMDWLRNLYNHLKPFINLSKRGILLSSTLKCQAQLYSQALRMSELAEWLKERVAVIVGMREVLRWMPLVRSSESLCKLDTT